MSGEVFVLMYHRVCEPDAQTACWFARGTAITPARFEAQMAWLRARARFVTLAEALAPDGESCSTPRCVVTFDDGYRDALVATRLGIPVTVFAVTQHTGDASEPLWFDRYYDILHRARRRRGVTLGELSLDATGSAPSIDDDLRWWVRGPLKERLQTLPDAERARALDTLAEVFDADGCTTASELYLTRSELRNLSAVGHCVGGHGATHTRLTLLGDHALSQELTASQDLLDAVAPSQTRLFCYPDGAHDARVDAATRRAGFVAACTVEKGILRSTTNAFAIPRMLMRDVLPGDPRWPIELASLPGLPDTEVLR